MRSHKGECVGIIGTNGSGKSTLLKNRHRCLKPDERKRGVKGKSQCHFWNWVQALIHSIQGKENIYLLRSNAWIFQRIY